ncbi:lysozyme [Tetragenococcus halophilus subsp. flandriensis]|uniref:glucosaminidase domain-containing protein n=1 Tax=Tetragenococcus halophilus TaxID=51669 RepID=UPI0023E9861D|nr:glucosaminidase domain-containing protein [Tetragenococcus halophilus]GMA08268.1 lysozyme [Tetragenococcus halophilus subsp. flandriensis]
MKKKILKKLIVVGISGLFLMFFLVILLFAGSEGQEDSSEGVNIEGEPFTDKFTKGLPSVEGVKGRGQISDEIAQYAVGTAIKYKLLPSVILSQYAYESEWGKSQSGKEDNNYFGVTWFSGAPYPKGSSRGVGGSEGGNYVKFPNDEEAFNYYGYMLASQDNFNASVGEKDPGKVLLILGRGGYAAAGITKSSPYYTGAMGIIDDNKLKEYDKTAMKQWGSSSDLNGSGNSKSDKVYDGEWTNPLPGTSLEKTSFQGGQLFGRHAGGEFRQNGWHHGLDFGSTDHKGDEIVAVHDGKVKFVDDPGVSALGAVVIVIDTGEYELLYQEFASSKSSAMVKEGDEVKMGDTIGTRDTDHLHLSMTKKEWRKGLAYAFTDNGYWEDPLPILRNGK